MTKRQVQDYLQDILNVIAAIEQFTQGIEFAAFSQNLEKIFAFSRAIEIIGEAVKASQIQSEISTLIFPGEILLECETN